MGGIRIDIHRIAGPRISPIPDGAVIDDNGSSISCCIYIFTPSIGNTAIGDGRCGTHMHSNTITCGIMHICVHYEGLASPDIDSR